MARRKPRIVELDEPSESGKSLSTNPKHATAGTDTVAAAKMSHRPRVEVLDKPSNYEEPACVVAERHPDFKMVARAPKALENFMMAPIMSTFQEEQTRRKDWEDKPTLKENIALPDGLALKTMAIYGLVEILQDRFPELRRSKFDIGTVSFTIPVSYGVKWLLHPLLHGRAEKWSVDRLADFCSERFVSPTKFVELLDLPDDAILDWNTMTVHMDSPGEIDPCIFTFTEPYSNYLNAPELADRDGIVRRYRQLVNARKDPSQIYDDMIRIGKLCTRVRPRRYYELITDCHTSRFCLRDIEHLPELQFGLVSEYDTAFVLVSQPLPGHLREMGNRVWDVAFANLRRLYVSKTWFTKSNMKVKKPDKCFLYFLEAYDVECISFIATTMFMPERMKDAAKLEVIGDLVMIIARDDCVFLTGAQDEWGMAYLAHLRSDLQANQAYVGVVLRLITLDNGTLAWINYTPRTANELVVPSNRCDVDVFTANVQTKVKPTGCASCFSMLMKLRVCSRCHDIFYCSKDCQKAHWPYHKDFCVKREGKDKQTKAKKELLAASQIKHIRKEAKIGQYKDLLRANLPEKYHEQLDELEI